MAWCFDTAAWAGPQVFVALDYEVTPETNACPTVEQFQASVERQLSFNPFRSSASRRLAVKITRQDVGLAGQVRWTNAEGDWLGERRITSRHADCSELIANLVFSVSVQIQLLATLDPSPPTGVAVAPAPTPPPPRRVDEVPDKVPTIVVVPPPPLPVVPPRRLTLSVGIGPSLGFGVAPHPTGIGRIFIAAGAPRLSLDLAVDGAVPTTQTQIGGSAFSLNRFAAIGAVCGHRGVFGACLTGTIGRLQARGVGVDSPSAPSGWFSQIGARIVATREFGSRYFASARVDALVMPSLWTVTLNGAAVWKTPRLNGLIGLDLGAHFL